MEKVILDQDVIFEHKGKTLLVGLREYDDSEINMVLGEVVNDTTFDQTWSSGYDRNHIKSSEQFCKEIFTPWCNEFVQEKYGSFEGAPLQWWEEIGKWFKSNHSFDPAKGFSVL